MERYLKISKTAVKKVKIDFLSKEKLIINFLVVNKLGKNCIRKICSLGNSLINFHRFWTLFAMGKYKKQCFLS